MSRKNENTGFTCQNCGIIVQPLTNGSYRNHCPECLYSKHVDIYPGDRNNDCHGMMKPIALDYNSKKRYQLIHFCIKCGFIGKNKVASNSLQEDQYIRFMQYISK